MLISPQADFSDDLLLKSLVEPVPILAASWLSQCTPITPLIQTHIKLLRTTAPKDMKEAKELRLQGKAAAKWKRLGQKKTLGTHDLCAFAV